jgi:hypothetical protein
MKTAAVLLALAMAAASATAGELRIVPRQSTITLAQFNRPVGDTAATGLIGG